jgi:hypothetical protein
MDRDLGREKRSELRHAVQYQVRFRSELLDFDAEAEWLGEVRDISAGGLFVKCEYFEPPGTPVSLLVWFPDRDEPVAMRGHVAWVAEHPPKGPGMGIKLAQTIDA